MPGSSHQGPLPDLSDDERALEVAMRRHVEVLAGVIGARSTACWGGLARARAYVERAFREAGYDDVRSLPYDCRGRTVYNLEVEMRGVRQPDRIVVVGAHYDAFLDCPGANDNASGVAALLEIARSMRLRPTARTLRFVAFVNEEPPHFARESMGSRVYARAIRQRGDNVTAMLALETIGYYSSRPGSQRYPPPFSWYYPDTGDFIGFVGNLGSRGLVRECVGSFRKHTRFPSEGAAAPGMITGIGWSDHRSFWQEGYPGVMVTDTALFRYRHYHQDTDTANRLDYPSMARVTGGLIEVITDLAGR